jgi:uncharacterized Zn finger protein (UPF0148 family)
VAKKACVRCGLIGERHKGVVVCQDCKYVMSKEEWDIWNDRVPDVELSHGKEAA